MIGRTNTKFLAIILICLITAVFTVAATNQSTVSSIQKCRLKWKTGVK